VIAYNPFAAEAGRLSYATYLCHVPVLTIVIATGMRMTGRDDQPLIVVLALVALPITVALSVLLNRLVEQPGIHLGKRLLSSRPAARAAS
jgi:peptidoglycan/LPS O-acetylase OafA/YrhL